MRGGAFETRSPEAGITKTTKEILIPHLVRAQYSTISLPKHKSDDAIFEKNIIIWHICIIEKAKIFL